MSHELVNVTVPQIPLTVQKEIVKADLLAKFGPEDWHGVRDAAVDIELLELKIQHAKATA